VVAGRWGDHCLATFNRVGQGRSEAGVSIPAFFVLVPVCA
jgi:hypothetical protein